MSRLLLIYPQYKGPQNYVTHVGRDHAPAILHPAHVDTRARPRRHVESTEQIIRL